MYNNITFEEVYMKHICAALLAALLALSCLAVTAFADGTEGGRMYGDVNGDGKINLRDVILVIRVSLEYDEKIDREMADVNLDEKIDMKDILLLMKEVIGGRDLRLGMHFYNSSTVYDAVIDSVVTIYIYDGAGRELGLGSGFIYTSDGLCITCLHVVAGASRIEVVLNDGTRHDAEYVSGYSAELDMAAVKINASGLKPLEISDRSPQSDEKVWAFGSPDGVAGTMTEALAQGYKWTAGGFGKNAGYLMLDVPMIPGNSGGPVIDMNGRVVGVVSMTGIAMSAAWDTEQLYSENLGAEISISDFEAQTEDYASSRYLDETDDDYIPKNNVVYGASLDGLLDTDTFRFRVTEGSAGAITYSIPAGSRNSIAAAVTGLPEDTEWRSNYNAYDDTIEFMAMFAAESSDLDISVTFSFKVGTSADDAEASYVFQYLLLYSTDGIVRIEESDTSSEIERGIIYSAELSETDTDVFTYSLTPGQYTEFMVTFDYYDLVGEDGDFGDLGIEVTFSVEGADETGLLIAKDGDGFFVGRIIPEIEGRLTVTVKSSGKASFGVLTYFVSAESIPPKYV